MSQPWCIVFVTKHLRGRGHRRRRAAAGFMMLSEQRSPVPSGVREDAFRSQERWWLGVGPEPEARPGDFRDLEASGPMRLSGHLT